MKKTIHPTYNQDVQVICSCGNSFKTGSTKSSISVEVCYKCHPFFTGEHRLLDVQGRADSFKKKQEQAKKYKSILLEKKTRKDEKSERKTKSLRELLAE